MKNKSVKTDTLKNAAAAAMVSAGMLIFLVVILHAAGVTDLRVNAFSVAVLCVLCIIFVAMLALFFAARKICNRGAVEEAESVAPPAPAEAEAAAIELGTVSAEPSAPEIAEPVFDRSFTLKEISANLAAYAAEKSFAISEEFAKKVIAAMCSSRLVAVARADEKTVEKLIEVLNGYFGGESKSLKESLLYAYGNGDTVVIANVKKSDGAQALSAFAARAFCPGREARISFGGGSYSNLFYNIPRNVWAFTACSAVTEREIAEAAAIVDFEAGARKKASGHRWAGYYQFVKSAELSLDAYAPDEDNFWKKCDKLEKFIAETSGYRAGNKKWRAIEAFASAYLACGGENVSGCTAAAHYAAPARLSGITAEQFAAAAEEIFGEDCAAVCRKIADAVTGG